MAVKKKAGRKKAKAANPVNALKDKLKALQAELKNIKAATKETTKRTDDFINQNLGAPKVAEAPKKTVKKRRKKRVKSK